MATYAYTQVDSWIRVVQLYGLLFHEAGFFDGHQRFSAHTYKNGDSYRCESVV
jgi:hypothetical protein